jgi:putative transposase
VRRQIRGADVVATLDQVGRESDYPKAIRLDNGPEFITREPDLWAFMRGVSCSISAGRASRPTKPSLKSQNGKFRAECLNANWFLSLDQARRKCEAWLRDYNEGRPHNTIGNQVPAMLHRSAGSPGQAATR